MSAFRLASACAILALSTAAPPASVDEVFPALEKSLTKAVGEMRTAIKRGLPAQKKLARRLEAAQAKDEVSCAWTEGRCVADAAAFKAEAKELALSAPFTSLVTSAFDCQALSDKTTCLGFEHKRCGWNQESGICHVVVPDEEIGTLLPELLPDLEACGWAGEMLKARECWKFPVANCSQQLGCAVTEWPVFIEGTCQKTEFCGDAHANHVDRMTYFYCPVASQEPSFSQDFAKCRKNMLADLLTLKGDAKLDMSCFDALCPAAGKLIGETVPTVWKCSQLSDISSCQATEHCMWNEDNECSISTAFLLSKAIPDQKCPMTPAIEASVNCQRHHNSTTCGEQANGKDCQWVEYMDCFHGDEPTKAGACFLNGARGVSLTLDFSAGGQFFDKVGTSLLKCPSQSEKKCVQDAGRRLMIV